MTLVMMMMMMMISLMTLVIMMIMLMVLECVYDQQRDADFLQLLRVSVHS